jgi:predicted transcriptional regulator
MINTMPTIITVMTPFPQTINGKDSITRAEQLMQKKGIHHLPVVIDGIVESIVSSQDLNRAKLIGHRVQSYEQLRIGDISSTPACFSDINDPLDKVLLRMVKLHIKAVIVTKDGLAVGIFTSNDACLKLAQLLQEKFPLSEGDDVA